MKQDESKECIRSFDISPCTRFAVEAWKLAARMGEKEDLVLGLLSLLFFNLVYKNWVKSLVFDRFSRLGLGVNWKNIARKRKEKGTGKKQRTFRRSRTKATSVSDSRLYPRVPVCCVEAWKLAARMGEKEDWSLVRVLTKLVRDCSSPLGYYTLVPKPGRPCQAKPSAAKALRAPEAS